MVLVGIAILSLAFLGVALVAICLHDLGLINPELELMGIVLVPILLIYTLVILSSPQLQNGNVWHSVLTRGALDEVVNLTKPMIEYGLGGLDRPCASLITLCSSRLGQKLPKNGHIWVHRP